MSSPSFLELCLLGDFIGFMSYLIPFVGKIAGITPEQELGYARKIRASKFLKLMSCLLVDFIGFSSYFYTFLRRNCLILAGHQYNTSSCTLCSSQCPSQHSELSRSFYQEQISYQLLHWHGFGKIWACESKKLWWYVSN